MNAIKQVATALDIAVTNVARQAREIVDDAEVSESHVRISLEEFKDLQEGVAVWSKATEEYLKAVHEDGDWEDKKS